MTNLWFLCRTDSVGQTSSEEMAKNKQKGDMVKLKNHCTKKIRLGHLENRFFCLFFWQQNEEGKK